MIKSTQLIDSQHLDFVDETHSYQQFSRGEVLVLVDQRCTFIIIFEQTTAFSKRDQWDTEGCFYTQLSTVAPVNVLGLRRA